MGAVCPATSPQQKQHHTNLYLYKREEERGPSLLLLSCWIASSFLWLPGTQHARPSCPSSQRAPPIQWTWAWVRSKGSGNCCKLVIATVSCGPLEHLQARISTRCEEPLWLLLEISAMCSTGSISLHLCCISAAQRVVTSSSRSFPLPQQATFILGASSSPLVSQSY